MPRSDYPLAPLTAVAYRFRDPSELQALSMTSTGITDIVNVTEAGLFHGFYIFVDATLDGSPVINLEITVDGGTKETIPIFESASNFVNNTWQRIMAFDSTNNTNEAGAASDMIRIMGLNIPYLSSLRVSINVVTAASAAGALNCGVFRSTEQ